jgi:hypothetical protein
MVSFVNYFYQQLYKTFNYTIKRPIAFKAAARKKVLWYIIKFILQIKVFLCEFFLTFKNFCFKKRENLCIHDKNVIKDKKGLLPNLFV